MRRSPNADRIQPWSVRRRELTVGSSATCARRGGTSQIGSQRGGDICRGSDRYATSCNAYWSSSQKSVVLLRAAAGAGSFKFRAAHHIPPHPPNNLIACLLCGFTRRRLHHGLVPRHRSSPAKPARRRRHAKTSPKAVGTNGRPCQFKKTWPERASDTDQIRPERTETRVWLSSSVNA
jgi:hypothetical protein